MTIGGFLKASWDHLPPMPKKPRLPPSLFSLKSRKAWLAVQPTFTYGDERDKIQKENARRAKKQLARDEAWVIHEKKKAERAKRKELAKRDKSAKRLESQRMKAKLAQAKASGSRSAPPPAAMKPRVQRSATVPISVKPRSAPVNAHTVRSKPIFHTSPQAGPGKSRAPQVVHRSRTVTPQSRPSVSRTNTKPVKVQPWGPIRAATSPVATSPPRVVRAATYPSQRRP